MAKAVIFDFDGVIVQSEPARFAAVQRVANRYGVQVLGELFRQLIGRTTNDFFNLNFPDLDMAVLKKY